VAHKPGLIYGVLGCVVRFWRASRGNVGVISAIAVPVLVLGVGGGLDYGLAASTRTEFQGLADGAALAGVRSFMLANATAQSVSGLISGFVSAQRGSRAPNAVVTSNVSQNLGTVTVQIDGDYSTVFLRMVGMPTIHVSTKATARLLTSSVPNCLIALDSFAGHAIEIDKGGVLGPHCMLYSDSTAADALKISGGATVTAAAICSAGGVKDDSNSAVSPPPRTDCPSLSDPLATIPQPSLGTCTEMNMKLQDAVTTLMGGVYCGGLEIGGKSVVSISQGLYVIKDGALKIKDSAAVSGSDVTFFLTGQNAVLDLDNGTSINLSAPKNGPLAGMLIFEDRSAQLNQHHQIKSRNAPNMLGTIYLSRGILDIGIQYGGGGKGLPVAQSSDWTVVIARQVSIQDDMQIVFNTDYAASPVHPPAGLSTANAAAVLSQ
jgi:Flp pilus assembly protein TadG